MIIYQKHFNVLQYRESKQSQHNMMRRGAQLIEIVQIWRWWQWPALEQDFEDQILHLQVNAYLEGLDRLMPARYHLSTMALQYNNCTILYKIYQIIFYCAIMLCKGPLKIMHRSAYHNQGSLSQLGSWCQEIPGDAPMYTMIRWPF